MTEETRNETPAEAAETEAQPNPAESQDFSEFERHWKAEGEAEDSQSAAEDEAEEGAEEAEASDSETEDPENDTEEDLDDDLDDDEPSRNKTPARKRIAALTKARREAERAAIAAEERARLLEERLTRLEQGQQQPKDDQAQGAQAERNENEPPDPANYTYGELDPQYLDDVVDYKTRKALSDFERKQQETAAQEAARKQAEEAAQKWEQRSDEARSRYADFDQVVGPDESGQRGWACSKEMADLILQSDVGADVAYRIASDPRESERIANLPVAQQAVLFGRLEGEILAQRGAQDRVPSKKTPTISSPPPRVRGTDGKFKIDPATTDFASFERLVKSQRT